MESWTPENFLHQTDQMANSVRDIIAENYRLRLFRDRTSGEVCDAYNVIIKANTKKIHMLVGKYRCESDKMFREES